MTENPIRNTDAAAAMAWVAGGKDRPTGKPARFVPTGPVPEADRRVGRRAFVRAAERDDAANRAVPKVTAAATIEQNSALFGTTGDLAADARTALDLMVEQAQEEKKSAPQPLRRPRTATPAFMQTFADAFPGGGGSDSGGGMGGAAEKKVTKEETGNKGQVQTKYKVRRKA